ncbi:MAG: adenylyltransferase/cytidyltransferase family protein [Bryobacteraceae bacterium]|nr:adenylyltransferase/cytidyltransferase family protein [Bryobacteraceae bacterium]
MALELARNPINLKPDRIAIFPGAFNPPTRAHIALAEAAYELVDEVVCVVPRAYPHKSYDGAAQPDRVRMLIESHRRYAVGVSDGGLYVEIAMEAREVFGPAAEIFLVCGRDAAERILNWDYGPGFPVDDILRQFGLLVAARKGEFQPPAHLRDRVRSLNLGGEFDDVSSSLVRERMRAGEAWEALVPGPIQDLVREIYA